MRTRRYRWGWNGDGRVTGRGVIVDRFVQRPSEVEAVQVTVDNAREVARWCGGTDFYAPAQPVVVPAGAVANVGDWVVCLDSAAGLYAIMGGDEFDRRFVMAGEVTVGA